MAEVIKMPRLSDTMTDGVVAKWHKKIGDVIKEGDLLADIETDKATMEFESFQEGVLLYIGVKENETAEVDSILAILGKKDEDITTLLDSVSNENQPENNSSNSSVMLITVVAILVLLLPIFGLFGNQSMIGIALADCNKPSPNDPQSFDDQYLEGEYEDLEEVLYESCKKYRSNFRLATIVIIFFNGLVIATIKKNDSKNELEKNN